MSTTSTPRRAKAVAAVKPPTPPPTTSTRRISLIAVVGRARLFDRLSDSSDYSNSPQRTCFPAKDLAPVKVAIFNIAKILSGDIAAPIAAGDTIILDDGKIVAVGTGGDAADCEVAIDAGGMMAMPGLIDSHVHITFGDYTPRQKTVGFLESYIHGGVTTCISASEVHVPGRPRDPSGVKALAIAAKKSFEHYRPGGMRVHAGSVILEPGLLDADFAELANQASGWPK